MGRIGKDFVRKVRAFGVKIIYNTRTQLDQDIEHELGIRYVPKDELLRTSDIISCLCPGTTETFHLINDEEFSVMKGTPSMRKSELRSDGVFFINSSRGSVVNKDALIRAIESNKIKRCALDVIEGEPKIPEYLLNNPRVTFTPRE